MVSKNYWRHSQQLCVHSFPLEQAHHISLGTPFQFLIPIPLPLKCFNSVEMYKAGWRSRISYRQTMHSQTLFRYYLSCCIAGRYVINQAENVVEIRQRSWLLSPPCKHTLLVVCVHAVQDYGCSKLPVQHPGGAYTLPLVSQASQISLRDYGAYTIALIAEPSLASQP